jgi:NADPH:quinone reductase-like Zn-dependent oxidoreductase
MHFMKAIRIHEHGGPEVLKFEDVPEPVLRKDQVLVRVKACALNHLDIFVRQGVPGVPLPQILGSDVSGDVVEVGEYITDVKTGTRVLLAPMYFCGVCEKCTAGQQNFCPQFSVRGYRVPGGDCELVAVARVAVVPIPQEITYDEAASVPLVFLTAWHMLVGRAQIRPGRGLGGHSDREAMGMSRDHDGGKRKQVGECARTRSRLHDRPLQAEDFR